MIRSSSCEITVGVVANPASGRDIRRLVSRASVFPLAEKCSMLCRLLAALGATGVERVLMMPEEAGLSSAFIGLKECDLWNSRKKTCSEPIGP